MFNRSVDLNDVVKFCEPLSKEEWDNVCKVIQAHQKHHRAIVEADERLDRELSALESPDKVAVDSDIDEAIKDFLEDE